MRVRVKDSAGNEFVELVSKPPPDNNLESRIISARYTNVYEPAPLKNYPIVRFGEAWYHDTPTPPKNNGSTKSN